MKTRGLAVLLALSLAGFACGGSDDVYEVPPRADDRLSIEDLPEPVPAVPAFVVRSRNRVDEDRLEQLRETDGVAVVATVTVSPMIARSKRGKTPLLVATVDPATYRSVAPPATRDADFVWLTLLRGEAVITHEAVERLGRSGTKRIDLGDAGSFRVGAIAENGDPNFADILLSTDALPEETEESTRVAVVGAASGVTLEALGRDLKAVGPDVKLHRVAPETVRVVTPPPDGSGDVPAPPVPAGTYGLHPTMAASVARLLQYADGRVWIVSGYRTPQRQYQLWIGALQKYGDPDIADNWVAPPGHSLHERGLAVDLGGDLAFAAQLVQELQLPLWRPMSWEPWHFELVGSRG